MSSVVTSLRLVVGLTVLAALVAAFLPCLIVLLPSRRVRIRVGNAFGHVAGRSMLAICGARVDPTAARELEAVKPAIFVSNHASIVDIFAGIWLAPYDTCGVAKKEVVWYPFFGLLYLVSGHLRVDRGNRTQAVGALRGIAEVMKRHRLGAWIWPEGTRARDGRLLPFKKGFAHLALATGLPVVPVMVTGAHRIWPRQGLSIRPGPLGIRVLPSIDTSGWSLETLDSHVEAVRQAFVDALPEDQRPLPLLAAK